MKNRVKELREAKHLTQTGLALKVGSTQQTISKIEREIGVPKLDLALIMADFFNVTLEYLFCLSDKKHKLEHQIKIDKTIEEFYDFFVDYQDLNSENKVTLNLIMLRLLEVLLISESSTEDDIYCMIDQIIKIDKIIEAHDISEELSYITDIQYDIIIINYDKVRIRHGDFKMIFDIRCKTQAPLLVILEGCEIRDKLHVLNMKADDYIEKPINIDELEEKMLQLLHKLS